MKYIINSTVAFDTTEYLLTLVDDANTSVKLSNSAGRVLEELIQYRGTGEPVTREHLFANVWSAHGLNPSNGNLNQQVSIIRKGLTSLGLDASAIVTFPKRGLKLNDQLVISFAEEDIPPPTYTPAVNTFSPETTQPPTAKPSGEKKNINATLILLMVIAMLLTVSMAYIYYEDDDSQKLYFFSQINLCKIYTFHPISELEKDDYNLRITEAMTENIDCTNNYIIIFSKMVIPYHLIQNNINVRTFMAKSRREDNGYISHYLNFFFYNRDEI
ncbi:MAG: putative transcriptional regulator YqeI [Sodalis sp. Psp]|nr:putative transcriptional regulator YqeI [Sodalis sp. Psp]MCR3757366.1 putative transcriptional regulator YqeI [Sodalis sp. Ppy]